MPIQTSQITTAANGDLNIAPNGTGKTKVASVDVTRADAGFTEDTPVSIAQDGTVKKTSLPTLPELLVDNLVSTDLIAVQKVDGDFYYVKAEDLANAGLINPPVNANLTITPTPGGGGTQANPFVLTPVTVSTPGGSAVTVETFTISGAPANGILYVTFTNNQGGRFQDKVLVADASGNIPAFNLVFNDVPASATGTVYTGVVRFGTASVYCTWAVTQQVSNTEFTGSDGVTPAPNGSPAVVDSNGIFGTGTGAWSDGTKSLVSTSDVQFRVNGGSYTNGTTTASNGNTAEVIFRQSTVDAAAEGATISGVLSSTDGTYSKSFSMVKDITPNVTLGSVSNTPLGAAAASSSTVPTGYNALTQVTAGTAGPTEMTSIKVSIDGGAFVNMPQNIYPGQSISVQGVVGSAANTTYTANVNIGNTAAVFTATTTAAATATIQQPSITSPADGSTGISTSSSLASDAYVGNNSPGPHTSSAWEVYEAAAGTGKPSSDPPGGAYTQVVNATNDTTNLTSYPLSGVAQSGKSYYSRVKYKDDGSTGSTVESTFSVYNEFTASASLPVPWASANAAAATFWVDIAYGNGKFVAVGNGGTTTRVMYSTDGITWTGTSAGVPVEWWTAVTYANGKFVAVSQSGSFAVMYSTDGINWSTTLGAENSYWYDIVYGNGKYVAVSSSGTNRVMHSTDGITWTGASATTVNNWYSVAFGGGKFVSVAFGGINQVMYSTDGVNWSNSGVSGVPSLNWANITYGAGKFIAVSADGGTRVMYSTNGINWTTASAAENNMWLGVAYGNGSYVAVARDGTNRVMYSTDGVSWTAAAASAQNEWQKVAYGNGKFVAIARTGSPQVMYAFA